MASQGALDFRVEAVSPWLQLPVHDRPAHDRRIDRRNSRLPQPRERCRGAPVDEFRAELHGNRQAGNFERPDAAANPITRFEHDGGLAATGELGRRRQAGGAGAKNRKIVDHCKNKD